MELPVYQVDAFASEVFRGNPAAIMPLDGWVADDMLQAIAMENNLSETAFYVSCDKGYELRVSRSGSGITLDFPVAERLGTSTLVAKQISARGGDLACELKDGRVFMTGTAVTFMIGTVILV